MSLFKLINQTCRTQIKMLTNGYTHIHDEPKVVPHLEKGNKAYRINIHEHRIQHSKYV